MQVRALALIALAIALVVSVVHPARADFADSLFAKLKSLPTGIDPDQLEMARYAVRHPTHADTIFTRAATENYPFFALVGAVKAAKNRNLPEIGVFTEAKCLLPITAIDQVFGQSAAMIDNAKGQADTKTAIGLAKTYAADYAKAQNDDAKQKLIAELADAVPYFRDIPVICNFGFETDFKLERNLQQLITQTVRDLREAYAALKSGNVVYGVEKLVSAGLDPKFACEITDDAIAGGLIGKTPLIGDLAKGACKSFAGKVIKGIASLAGKAVKAGEKAVAAAACAVETLWGGCDDATPQPPSGIGEAQKFCAPFGGIQFAQSKTNQPNDFAVICHDGARCIVEPGKPPRCASAQQIAQHKAELLAATEAGFQAGQAAWLAHFDSAWLDPCQDDPCRVGMKLLRINAVLLAKQTHDADPASAQWYFVAIKLKPSEAAAEKLLAESKARAGAFNSGLTANAAEGWEGLVIGKWGKECLDAICVAAVEATAKQMHAAMLALQKAQPDASALSVQGQIGQTYGPIYRALVEDSKKRKLIADPNAPPVERLHAFGCQNFLGRANQYLCNGEPGWAACVQYVKQSKAQVCMSNLHGPYTDAPSAILLLANQGCQRQGAAGLAFKCTGVNGPAICAKMKANGMAVSCN